MKPTTPEEMRLAISEANQREASARRRALEEVTRLLYAFETGLGPEVTPDGREMLAMFRDFLTMYMQIKPRTDG